MFRPSDRRTMRRPSILLLLAVAILLAASTSAMARETCPPAFLARLLRADAAHRGPVRVACSLHLRPRDRIVRPLVLGGAAASGVVVDCGGALLDPGTDARGRARDAIVIRARRTPAGWSRPRDVTIRDCRINGSIRIFGMGMNGQAPAVRRSSRHRGHVARLRQAAPTRITLENLVITGRGRVPLYIAPGVTRVRLLHSRLGGRSDGPAIYLDAESGDNEIRDNVIDVATRREAIAVDGSTDNLISGNRIRIRGRGGIHLYRNCGEGGTIRHRSPRHNRIVANIFIPAADRPATAGWKRMFGLERPAPAVWLGSRQGNRSYCDEDAGLPFGSSSDDRDHATDNTVAENIFVAIPPSAAIAVSDTPNTVRDNRFVKRAPPASGLPR